MMRIRLRLFLAALGVAAVLIGAVWLFRAGGVSGDALPLVKADLTPVKVEASAIDGEDADKETAPQETSTVFNALAGQPEEAPRLPPADAKTDVPANPPQFAGFRTGFAMPRPEQPKTETLYGTPETQPEPAAVAQAAPAEAGAAEAGPVVIQDESEETVQPQSQPVADEAVAQVEPTPEPAPVSDKEEWTIRDVIPSGLLKNPFKNETAREMEAAERENLAASGTPPRAKDVPPPPDAGLRAPDAQEKAVTPAPAPAPAAALAPQGQGDWYIQLSSTPDMAAAQATWADVTRRNPGMFTDIEPRFQEADLGKKGKFVRVQAGPLTERDANRKCAEYKAKGQGDCILVKR